MKEKTIICIPVRMSSERLPNKPLFSIGNNPAFIFLANRMKFFLQTGIAEVVVCTTLNPADDVIASIAEDNEIKVFRGDEMNIPRRLLGAAKMTEADFIINVDGDDVLCDVRLVRDTIDSYRNKEVDFIKWKDLPFGISPFGIKVSALEKICEQIGDVAHTGWVLYFDRGEVRTLTKRVKAEIADIRLTLDYMEDFILICKVVQMLDGAGSLKEIIKLFEQHPELKNINSGVVDKYWKRFEQKQKDEAKL